MYRMQIYKVCGDGRRAWVKNLVCTTHAPRIRVRFHQSAFDQWLSAETEERVSQSVWIESLEVIYLATVQFRSPYPPWLLPPVPTDSKVEKFQGGRSRGGQREGGVSVVA